ncbi:MAG: hypothetical protein V4692_06780 [Bdellovibrionota bacterium]
MLRSLIIISCAFSIFGCASKGFDRGSLREQIGTVKPVVNDSEIKEVLARKPNLPKPFKLAVYFKRPISKSSAEASWRWTDQDKDLVTAAANELSSEKIISSVSIIPESLVLVEDLKSIRLAAARQSANAVLVIDGAAESDRYINNWGWSYMLLVPALFVKGSEVDTLFMSSAVLWDVGNEYLYLTTEAEGLAHETYAPVSTVRDEDLFKTAKSNSLEKLKAQIVSSIKGSKN